MTDVCVVCGLPKELCVCETIARESQKIIVSIEKKKFGKKNTQISGLKDVDMKDLTKRLKSKFACGGTAKDGVIELQGDHTKEIKDVLAGLGFAPDQIEIVPGKRH